MALTESTKIDQIEVVADWNIKFNKEVQNLETKEDIEIETSEKD